MKRSHATRWYAAPLCLAVLVCLTSEAAQAEETYGKAATFKLHVTRMSSPEAAGPDMVIPDGWHMPRRVDAALVEQIGQMRLSLPSWNGIHHLTPGGASGFN